MGNYYYIFQIIFSVSLLVAVFLSIVFSIDDENTKGAIFKEAIITFIICVYINLKTTSPLYPITMVIIFWRIFAAINFSRPTTYYYNGRHYFYYKDKSNIFFIQSTNPLRQLLGNLPIWIVPNYYYAIDTDLASLENASKLWYDIKNSLKDLSLPKNRKEMVSQQTYVICANITKALWKLAVVTPRN